MKIVNKTSPVLILAVSLLILVSGCTEHAQQQKQSVAPRPVKLLTIEDSSQSRTFTYPATIDAVQSSKLAFQVGGKLETVNIIAAQEVSQGEQLASLEKRTFQNQLNSAQAQYQTAKADFETVLSSFPTDKTSKMYIERCTVLLAQGLPENWDGVTRLSTK